MSQSSPGKISIQNKVTRFIAGTRNPRDLDAIFLWIRAKSFGLKTVKDIGDFVAHAEEKNQGIIWDRGSLLAAIFHFHIPRIVKHDQPSEAIDVAALTDATWAAFKMQGAADVKRRTGIGQNQAKRILEKALSKIYMVGSKVCVDDLNGEEFRIFDLFSTVIVVSPAFDDLRLIREFSECLLKNLFITEAEVPAVMAAREYVAIYAIEKMHLCHLTIENQSPCILSAHVSRESEGAMLSVMCATTVHVGTQTNDLIAEVFSTTCKAIEWVDETLWRPGVFGSWIVPIEISNSGKLTEST